MERPVRESSSVRLSRRAAAAGGAPISYLMHKALAQPEIISLAAGFVDQATLPVDAAREAIEEVLGDSLTARSALQYGTTPGYRPLREALANLQLAEDGQESGGSSLTPEQLVVTAGSNQLLHLVADTLFDPGDIVLCASPTYFVFLGLLRNLAIRSVGVASDADGMIPEALDESLRRLEASGQLSRVKAIYVVSEFDNPSIATFSVSRRAAIVELAKRWSHEGRIHVLEDSAYRHLRYDGDDLPSLRSFDEEGDTVVLARTFSKSFSPGIRVGWGILPEALVGPVCAQKGNSDFGSPNFDQYVMEAVLRRGLLAPHLARIRAGYRAKRDAMLAACEEFLPSLSGVSWTAPEGGLYVWLKLPASLDAGLSGANESQRLFDRALAEGMLYVPGEYCYASEGEPVAGNTIRLSYGVQSPERIRLGMAALGRAIEGCLQQEHRPREPVVLN